jgi:hypothetical protein
MEPIKINLKTPVKREQVVNFSEMKETSSELLIKISGSERFGIYVGQKLTFKRHIYESEKIFNILSNDVIVKEIENFNNYYIVHTTKLPNISVSLSKGLDMTKYIKVEDEKGSEEKYHVIKCTNNHNIFPQDLDLCKNGELFIKDYSNKIIATFKSEEFFIPFNYSNRKSEKNDCITLIDETETCGKRFNSVKKFRYDFAPEKISKNGILLKGKPFSTKEMIYIETNFNPFYFFNYEMDINGNYIEFDVNGEPIKKCFLYSDVWWSYFNNKNILDIDSIYVNHGDNNAKLVYDTSYWETEIGLSSYNDESKLGSDDNFNSSFIKNLEESLIPEIIDMERVKYVPMIYNKDNNKTRYYKWCSNNDNVYPVIYTTDWIDIKNTEHESAINNVYILNNGIFNKITNEIFYFDAYKNNREGGLYREKITGGNSEGGKKITYYTYNLSSEIIDDSFSMATKINVSLHFRKRREINTEDNEIELKERKQNTTITSGNVYFDGWFINEDEAETTWWNGMDYSESAINSNIMNTFIKNSGLTSDLIGYLNFTDNDIYFRKKKVSQSFLRLTFYNSTDPIEQKLLFYSTVFLDSTSLYGKYIKQMLYMKENNLFEEVKNMNAAVVFCDDENSPTRIDTKFSITNEYDRTKSSEGFNIYLFSSDRNINTEKNEKTIYMKVEFNHAGNGKTIPMIIWPKNEQGEYISLTTENFFDSLYIPIKMAYLNGKYIYYIPDAFKNEDGEISLVLFEPKLDFIPDAGINNDDNE